MEALVGATKAVPVVVGASVGLVNGRKDGVARLLLATAFETNVGFGFWFNQGAKGIGLETNVVVASVVVAVAFVSDDDSLLMADSIVLAASGWKTVPLTLVSLLPLVDWALFVVVRFGLDGFDKAKATASRFILALAASLA